LIAAVAKGMPRAASAHAPPGRPGFRPGGTAPILAPMLNALKPDILERLERHDWPAIRDALAEWPAPEIADLLADLRKPDRVLLYRALPRDLASDVFAYLDVDRQDALLHDLSDDETRHILANLEPDDLTHLLEELPGQVTQRMLTLLGGDDLREARFLLGYPEDSVGRLMTPQYVAVHPQWTIDQALHHIRATGVDSETINRIYVIDDESRLLDDISLRAIILASPDSAIADIMDHSYTSVSAFVDREESVSLIRKYDLVALPVVDSGGILVGIVTVDDVLDVAVEEATEDFHRVGSVGPIRMSLHDATLGFLYRRRIPWLLALVFMSIFTGAVLNHYEATIQQVAALVFFLPLLIGSAGNAGSQAATLMIRAMATGDVKLRDWFQLLGKELGVSIALGVTMAAGVALVAYYYGGMSVAVIVSATMAGVVMIGSMLGMSLPFLLQRFGMDPATASAPLVASIADITGVLLYFGIATWYLATF
jgi:magnesium transporter